jgi:hypothetical protein
MEVMDICGLPPKLRLRSKAPTEPATVLVPRENNPGLVAALERWIALACIQSGEALFRSIKKGWPCPRPPERWRRKPGAQGAHCTVPRSMRLHSRRGRLWSGEIQRAQRTRRDAHSGLRGRHRH